MEMLPEALTAYFVIPIFIFCSLIGICIKHNKVFNKWSNDWIPTIVLILGIIFSIIMNYGHVTFINIVSGAFSGWASTGAHQWFIKVMNNFNKREDI